MAAFGAILLAIASGGFAMGAVWFVGGKIAALTAGAATLLTTGPGVLTLFSEHFADGGRRDDSTASMAGMRMGFIAAVFAAAATFVAAGPWAAIVAGLAAGVVTGGVVGSVTSSLNLAQPGSWAHRLVQLVDALVASQGRGVTVGEVRDAYEVRLEEPAPPSLTSELSSAEQIQEETIAAVADEIEAGLLDRKQIRMLLERAQEGPRDVVRERRLPNDELFESHLHDDEGHFSRKNRSAPKGAFLQPVAFGRPTAAGPPLLLIRASERVAGR